MEKLYVEDVAKLLGIAESTWRASVSRARADRAAGRARPGLAPDPDGRDVDGQHARPWWSSETIDAYRSARVGQGARAHLAAHLGG